MGANGDTLCCNDVCALVNEGSVSYLDNSVLFGSEFGSKLSILHSHFFPKNQSTALEVQNGKAGRAMHCLPSRHSCKEESQCASNPFIFCLEVPHEDELPLKENADQFHTGSCNRPPMPPSMCRQAPVMKLACSDARKSAVMAISEGSAIRSSGCLCARA